MSSLPASLQAGLTALRQLPVDHPDFYAWYTLILRFLFPILAILMLVRIIRSLVKASPKPEVWAYLSLPNGAAEPLTHWENILGRSPASDVVLNYPVVSRQHAALIRTGEDRWTVHDLGSKSGTLLNGKPVDPAGSSMTLGDILSLGGVDTVLLPVSDEETARRKKTSQRPVSPWGSLILLTVFQVLTALQFLFSTDEEHVLLVPAAFLCLCLVMWLYCLTLRCLGRIGFEMETIAFFLSTLSLAVTASSAPASVPKQLLAVFLGIILFLVVGIFLRDLDRVRKIRWLMAAGAVVLLSLSLVAGHERYGAANWISLLGFSFQPSELAKICYIFAGAATLERLFRKRNLGLFILLTGACMGCLALMSDFGTAAIFFVTFLVIAYLRSGDYTTLALICGGAVFGGLVLVTIKPYILRRFAAWGHVWEQASDGGFQQTRTMSAIASGGLFGKGTGDDVFLKNIGAANTDLVFGVISEQFGLILALCAVFLILVLVVYASRCAATARSSYYVIAANSAAAMLVFQTTLNVLGAVDILPLTGVTFPFVSLGGSSMISCWGLLAFLKAADTRPNASFTLKLPKRIRGWIPPDSDRIYDDRYNGWYDDYDEDGYDDYDDYDDYAEYDDYEDYDDYDDYDDRYDDDRDGYRNHAYGRDAPPGREDLARDPGSWDDLIDGPLWPEGEDPLTGRPRTGESRRTERGRRP